MIAGIMWIGNSMLFNWLDRNLEKSAQLSRLSQGKIFMVHSGAFYDVEKKLLAPGEMPATLHWFKWQNFATWATGISLLVVVYYFHGAAFLVDPSRARRRAAGRDHALGQRAVLRLADLRCAVAHGRRDQPRFATALSIALLFGSIYAFAQVFSGRAAYIETGVLDRHDHDRQRVVRDRAVATRAGERDDLRRGRRTRSCRSRPRRAASTTTT